MERYQRFFTAEMKRDPFWEGSPPPLVVVFAPSAARAAKLLETTVKHGARSNYWFATFEALEVPAALFAHRFAVPFGREGRTLNGKFALAAA